MIINVGDDTGQISGVINNWDTFDAVNLASCPPHPRQSLRGKRQDFGPHRFFHQHPVQQGVGIFAAVRRRFGRRKNLALVHRVVAMMT